MSHQFYEADDHHHACQECDVIVEPHLVDELTLECPVAPCPEPANHGEPCVFIDGERGAECSYCGRRGGAWDDDEDETRE
jgi:hypothetical protein